jgi:putative membrane protein
MYDGWGDGGWGWGAWLLMGLMMLVFWGIVAALVIYVVRSVSHRPEASTGGGASADQAMCILDERFARGEIDVDEYSQRRDVLRGR